MEDAYLGLLANELNCTFVKLWDNYMAEKSYALEELETLKFNDVFFIYIFDLYEFFSVWTKYFTEIYYKYRYLNKY